MLIRLQQGMMRIICMCLTSFLEGCLVDAAMEITSQGIRVTWIYLGHTFGPAHNC